jgi:hypothetical protein
MTRQIVSTGFPTKTRSPGRRPLYDFDEGIRWAEARCGPSKPGTNAAVRSREALSIML